MLILPSFSFLCESPFSPQFQSSPLFFRKPPKMGNFLIVPRVFLFSLDGPAALPLAFTDFAWPHGNVVILSFFLFCPRGPLFLYPHTPVSAFRSLLSPLRNGVFARFLFYGPKARAACNFPPPFTSTFFRLSPAPEFTDRDGGFPFP